MCCWLHTPNRTSVTDVEQVNFLEGLIFHYLCYLRIFIQTNTSNNNNEEQNVHIIAINERTRCEKPPDYEAVTMEPPSYDDAIKLDPSALLPLTKSPLTNNNTIFLINTTSEVVPRPSSSLYNPQEAAVISVENICEQTCDNSLANDKKVNTAKCLPSTHEISR